MSRAGRGNSISLYVSLGLFLFFLFILSGIDVLSLKIGNASAVLLLPAVVAAAMYLGEWPGFLLGLITGTALDSVMAGATCFNTFTMMLLGLSAGLLSSYLLNNNLWSAIALSVLTSTVYFSLRWLFLIVLRGDPSAPAYFLQYSLPSLIYTAVWIIPMYYIVRFFVTKTSGKSEKR